MQKAYIHNKEYKLITNYKDTADYRKSFNALTQKTYGFNFEQYYQEGYWGDDYKPYSLLDGDTIVANVSVSIMDYLVLGEHKHYIQLGTVMTDPAYRNQGLSRFLIETIIGEWKHQCDMIYLFANDSVLNFYPKFGFQEQKEYCYSRNIVNNKEKITAEKLDMSIPYNRKLVEEKAANSAVISKIKLNNPVGLAMFYCTSFLKDQVYYIREQDTIAVAEYEGEALYLKEVFATKKVKLEEIIEPLTDVDVKSVILGFTPQEDIVEEKNPFIISLFHEDNTTLFALNTKDNLWDESKVLENNRLLFPLLSHA